MYKEALQIAYNAHKGQLRKQGLVSYIVHPLRVASQFTDDTKRTIAILHDVIEDTDVTMDFLKTVFPESVTDIVDILSRGQFENHFDYISRVKANDIATEIKIADIVDNLSDTLCILPKSMAERYDKSLDILIN